MIVDRKTIWILMSPVPLRSKNYSVLVIFIYTKSKSGLRICPINQLVPSYDENVIKSDLKPAMNPALGQT